MVSYKLLRIPSDGGMTASPTRHASAGLRQCTRPNGSSYGQAYARILGAM